LVLRIWVTISCWPLDRFLNSCWYSTSRSPASWLINVSLYKVRKDLVGVAIAPESGSLLRSYCSPRSEALLGSYLLKLLHYARVQQVVTVLQPADQFFNIVAT
jgi:hypothetical protein